MINVEGPCTTVVGGGLIYMAVSALPAGMLSNIAEQHGVDGATREERSPLYTGQRRTGTRRKQGMGCEPYSPEALVRRRDLI